MDIQVRKLTPDDDLSRVSKLIYETDNFIFPHFFGENKNVAKQIIINMMNADTLYNKDNICVACLGDEIVGVTVIAPSPVSINVGAFFESFEQAGADAEIDDAFQTIMKEYFIPMEAHPDGYYIACLCVDTPYRGKGIGSAMLDYVFSGELVGKDVYLDCLADNEIAISVYESRGFEKLFKFEGFTGLDYYKMIKRVQGQVEE